MILDNNDYFELEEIYKAFGSMPRLKILIHLSKCMNGGAENCECSVNDLSKIAGLSQSATSHQLKELKLKRIIKSRKDGLNIFYSLHDKHIFKIIESGLEHIKGEHCDE